VKYRLLRYLVETKRWAADEKVFFTRPVQVLRGVRREDLRPDLIAGLTVAVVVLPQAIAYAMIAELPPQMGLYAAVVAAVIGALWGCSYHLNTGPTNAISMLVLASLLTVAPPGSPQFLIAAGYMAIIAGVIKILMGLLRMGVLINFVSDSVVVGFTAGAGVLISFNQLRHLLRVDFTSTPELGETVKSLVLHADETHLPSLAIGLGAMAVIIIIKRFMPKWPAALISMEVASVITGVLNLPAEGVRVLGAIPRSLPPLADLPVLDLDLIW
jgi:SulP family sulfate permease